MRWDNLLVREDAVERAKIPLFADEALKRRLKTPEFAGITFYEVNARSIINHVPSDRFGFNWTINPYRGCSHACSYCLASDTSVLLGDGRTKPLGELQVGEEIYGTVRHGDHWRYVGTTVIDRWTTVKPAYRITLENGTILVASGDHRFLTDRGWKHVTGCEQCPDRRPHLTTADSLVGTGRFSEEREHSEAYRRNGHISEMGNDARLGVRKIEPLRVDLPLVDISTGTGNFIANGVISHNCFARPTHTYLDFDGGEDFGTKIVVKVNAVELLRKELRKPSWKGESIAMGTNTDNYQRAEGHYRLMRGIIKELNAVRNPYSILTKGTLIQRDLDLLVEGASRTRVSTSFSVGTVDEEVWRKTEPGTPHPMQRLEVVRKLNKAGIPCGVLMAPILPGISDSPEQLRETVRAAADAGATHITPLVLHLRPGVKEEFLPWLEDNYPDLVVPYEKMYKRSDAPKEIRETITRSVSQWKARHTGAFRPSRNHRSPTADDPSEQAPPAREEQTQLDLGL